MTQNVSIVHLILQKLKFLEALGFKFNTDCQLILYKFWFDHTAFHEFLRYYTETVLIAKKLRYLLNEITYRKAEDMRL